MFTTLLESGTKVTTQNRWLTTSSGFHMMVLAGAVVLTPQRELPPAEPPERIHTVYTEEAPLDRTTVKHTTAGPSGRTSGPPLQMPTIRSITDIVGITAPDIEVQPGTGSATDGMASVDPMCNDTSICVRHPAYGAGPLSAGQVDKPALAIPGNARPLYPELLRSAGIEGSVLMRFVIDTTGAVEPQSVQVVRADQELFSASVRRALKEHRFLPAEAAGRKVRMLVEQRFDFALNAR